MKKIIYEYNNQKLFDFCILKSFFSIFSKYANCLADTTSILIRAVCEIQIKIINTNKINISRKDLVSKMLIVNKFLLITVTTIFVKIINEVPFPIHLLSIILVSQKINNAPVTNSEVTIK